MKRSPKSKLLGSALFLAIVLSGCSKPKVAEVAPEEPPTVESTPAPATPVAKAPPATPPPIVKRLAPDGVFFLLRGKSVETPDGITGLKPGTTVMKQADGSFLAGSQKLQLRPDEITNDLDIAARIAGVDAQRQAAIRQASATQPATPPPAAAKPRSSSSATTPPTLSQPPASSVAATSSLSGNHSLGSAHTMAKDGWLWEKDDGGVWRRVKPLR